MELDSAFVATELGQGNRRGTDLQLSNRRRRQCFAVYREALVLIEFPGFVDQDLCKIGIDAPVAPFVRVGESTEREVATNARVVESAAKCTQAGDNIAQALAKGQLCKSKTEELVQHEKVRTRRSPS